MVVVNNPRQSINDIEGAPSSEKERKFWRVWWYLEALKNKISRELDGLKEGS